MNTDNNGSKPAYEMLIDFLKSQNPKCVESGAWTAIDFRLSKLHDGSYRVRVESHDIGFCFAPDGSFEGIYNFKD